MKIKNKVSSWAMAGLLSVAALTASAQCKEFKWPENRAKADESVAIYGDAMKQGNFRGATAAWQWMATNAPNWNTKLYIDGAEIYDKLADKEADAAKKQVLVDSLMWVYDMRIKNCGEEATVLNRKANAAFKYNIKTKEKVADLLALFDKVYELNGNNITDPTLMNYMNTVRANVLYLKNVPQDQILARYDKIQAAADAKIQKALAAGKTADADKLKATKSAIDDLLIACGVKVDCEFVKKNLEPKFRQNPTDIALAKKIFTFMLQGKCTDDPLWLESGEAIHDNAPADQKDCGLVKNLGLKYLTKENYEKSKELLGEALTICAAGPDKAEVLLALGGIENRTGSKGKARELYRQALAADPNAKEAYEKIGDLYMNSNECFKKVNVAEDRLIYIAAYDEYAKAGASAKMAAAKSQFPSKEDIFLLNWKQGEVKSTGCWIGESVTLRTRD
jgi:tetratricopeptide (TPR) repeat protein